MIAVLILYAALAIPAAAQSHPDLYGKSIEDLMATDVTSAGRKEQRLARVPAAIRVITAEDIRRSGATNIPDLLRRVPGLNVAQVNAHTWAVSARGFADEFANKMLVLIDGRVVYDPLFSGVVWDAQDLPLEDIERIEVIRGPGATVWGTNAVNGVINIITKPADSTQGALIATGGGSIERGFGMARYGGRVGRNGYYRVYGRAFDRELGSGPFQANDQQAMRGGFRADWRMTAGDKVTVQGSAFRTQALGPMDLAFGALPISRLQSAQSTVTDGDALGRWTHSYRSGAETTIQAYFDSSARDLNLTIANQPVFDIDRNTVDLDVQHHFSLGARHDIVAGAGHRFVQDSLTPSLNASFEPAKRLLNTFNTFVQDEIELIRRKAWLTVGVKVERNSYSGWVAEPSVKMLWSPNNRHSLWGAASRAHRIPSRTDVDMRIDIGSVGMQDGLPMIARLMGSDLMRPETLVAYEAGYRAQLSKRLAIDFAAFYNRYDNLRSIRPGTPFLDVGHGLPVIVLPQQFENAGYGDTRGAEIEASWMATGWWTLTGGYTRSDANLTDASQPMLTKDPRNMVNIQSSWRLPWRLEVDQAWYYSGRLDVGPTPGYNRYDVRLGWRAGERVEFSVVGQNLLRASHMEFHSAGDLFVATPARRGAYGKIEWRF